MSSRATSSRTRSNARTRRSTTTRASRGRTAAPRTPGRSSARSCSSRSSAGFSAASSYLPGPRLRPLKRGVRDRVTVRIVSGEAERPVDSRLQLLGEDVLEPVGFVMDVVDVKTEGLGQIELEQAVVADDLDRDALTGGCQADALVRSVVDELERGELLDHLARRGCCDPLLAGQRRDRDARIALLKLVDRLQVVLDRVGQGRTCHANKCRAVTSPACRSGLGTVLIPTTRSCSGRSPRSRST